MKNGAIAERYKTNEAAQVEIYGQIGTFTGKLLNLSVTGAYIQLTSKDCFPKQGDLLNITVTLQQLSRTHNVSAEVVWTRNRNLGINFIDKGEILERMMAKAGAF